jgi:hypothetical protein
MNRRSFLRRAGIAAAGAAAAPYILPSGRLFAATGARMANHVVVCLYAGGVRNLESVQKAEGNLMRNLLTGTEPISPDIAPGLDPLPTPILAQPLQKSGTLFKEFRYNEGPTGHYSAHTVALTGTYVTTDLSLKDPPQSPTIFELYRKHNSPSRTALNAWWISNQLGPYPALNFSSFDGYGAQFGANFIQPTSLVSAEGYNVLGNMRNFTNAQITKRDEIREFLNLNFSGQYDPNKSGVVNTPEEAIMIQDFIKDTLADAASGTWVDPWGVGGSMNGDMYNVYAAIKVMERFHPELMVVNMTEVDIAHFNYTDYASALRKADYAVAKLWQAIQADPIMANDTVLIVVPEHGRNLAPNTLVDAYGRYALDHTAIGTGGDQMSREIFCLIAGPPGIVVQDQVIGSVTGESIDVVPTIARILGFDTDIPSYVTPPGTHLGAAFV